MNLYDKLFRFEAIQAIFSADETVQGMLLFEAALARAQSSASIIPAESARIIATKCRANLFDARDLAYHAASAGNLAIPLIKKLTEFVAAESQDAARFVHYGATSQDVIDTAAILQFRRALELISRDLDHLVQSLAILARNYRTTPVAARTWMQQAVPTTFGFIAATWLDALLRHRARLLELRPRLFVLQFGGAVGTLAALAPHGPAIAKALAEDLKLELPTVPWHTQRDRIAELASDCALLTGTLGKIARDISLHSQTEVGELFEPAAEGRGGSSTLPHKRNPVTCAVVLSAALRTPGLAATIFSVMPQENQRGLGGWHAEWETLPELITLSAGALHHLANMIPGLLVDTARMRKNLDLTNGLIFAEAVSMALARKLGKAAAHTLVESACKKSASENRHLREVLSDPSRQLPFTPAELNSLFEPARYLGNAADFVDAVLAQCPPPSSTLT